MTSKLKSWNKRITIKENKLSGKSNELKRGREEDKVFLPEDEKSDSMHDCNQSDNHEERGAAVQQLEDELEKEKKNGAKMQGQVKAFENMGL